MRNNTTPEYTLSPEDEKRSTFLSPAARTSVCIIPFQLFTKLYLTSHHEINSVLVNKTTSISGEQGGDTPLPVFNASGQFLITIRFHAQKKEWKLKLVLVLFPFHSVCCAARTAGPRR